MINARRLILRYATKPYRFLSTIGNSRLYPTSAVPPKQLYAQRNKDTILTRADISLSPPCIENPSELVDYLINKKRTVEELLKVDIRVLPAELRLTCLEALLLSASSALLPNSSHKPRFTISSPLLSQSPTSYPIDRFSEVTAISLGIDPSSVAAMGLLPVNAFNFSKESNDWLQDERFQLLLLSTVAGAKEISRPRLLVLAACLRIILDHVSTKALASVLRLITLQINETSSTELIYISSLLNGLPGTQSSGIEADSSKTTVLSVEANLLREALRRHVMDRILEFESLGVMPLLRLAYDFGPQLSTCTDKQRLLGVVESVVSTHPKEQNLFTCCLMLSAMQEMGTHRSGLIRRCLGQIRRKLHLASIYPLTDQSSWLSSALASLANLSVGGPIPASFSHSQYSRLPAEINFLKNAYHEAAPSVELLSIKPGLDVHTIFGVDWARQLLFDVADYISDNAAGSTVKDSHPNYDGFRREHQGDLNLIRASLSLLALGVRHEKLIDACLKRISTLNDSASVSSVDIKSSYLSFVNLHISKPSDVLPTSSGAFPDLVDESEEHTTSLVSSKVVNYLPRADWQMYFTLAKHHCIEGGSSLPFDENTQDLFRAYLALKLSHVGTFIAGLKSRLRPELEIEILPFSVVQLGNGRRFFADIAIRKKSATDPSVSKCVLCFLCWNRDILVPRPLDTLMLSYKRKCTIPVLRFVHCDQHSQTEQNLTRDRYLKEIAITLRDCSGVPSESTEIHPIRNFVKYSEASD